MSKLILSISFLLIIIFNLSGCSVYMATKQPEKKDLSVLNIGTDRSHVIAELGAPIHTEESENGKMDIYKFIQGYSDGSKTGRALFHGAADVLTLGLWEVVGTPIEGAANGTEVKLEIIYDSEDKVHSVKALSGEEVIYKK